jgi:hypothetical protein
MYLDNYAGLLQEMGRHAEARDLAAQARKIAALATR